MRRSGFVLDGIIKLVLAVIGVVLLPALEASFMAPRWLVVTAFVLLFLSSATEISYGVRKGEKRYLRFPLIFDGLLVVAVVLGGILAAVGSPAGAWVLFGLVAVGSLVIAVVFTTGENGPEFGEDEPETT